MFDTLDELVSEVGRIIYDRSQMTQGDADDLAWDLVTLVKANPS